LDARVLRPLQAPRSCSNLSVWILGMCQQLVSDAFHAQVRFLPLPAKSGL
jgi:hypothetical protein